MRKLDEKNIVNIFLNFKILFMIFIKNGSLDKLKDLLSIFDSKYNKGKDVLFNQQFFIKMNDLSSLNTDTVKNMAKKIYISNGKIRTTSKGRFSPKTNLSVVSEKKSENKKSKSGPLSPNRNDSEFKRPIFTNLTKKNQNNILPSKENIILSQRLIQRFYAFYQFSISTPNISKFI